jgi:hypothetical protein
MDLSAADESVHPRPTAGRRNWLWGTMTIARAFALRGNRRQDGRG